MSSAVYAKKNSKRTQSSKGKNDSGIRGSYLKGIVADAFDDAKAATDALAEAEGCNRRAKKAAREAKKAKDQKEAEAEKETIPSRYCNKCYMNKPRQEFVEFECGRIWCGDCSKIKYACGTCGGVVLGARKCVVCDVKTGKKPNKSPSTGKTAKTSKKDMAKTVRDDKPKSEIKKQPVKSTPCYICGKEGEKLYDYYPIDDDNKTVQCCNDTLKMISAARCHICQVWRNSDKCPNKACRDAIANGCHFCICDNKGAELHDYYLREIHGKIVKCCAKTLETLAATQCAKCRVWSTYDKCPNTNCQEEEQAKDSKKEPKEKCDACGQEKPKTGFVTIPQVWERWCADCHKKDVKKPLDELIQCYVCGETIDRNGPDIDKTYMSQHLCNTCYIGVKIELDTRCLSKCDDCIKHFPSSMKWTKTLEVHELLCPDCGNKKMAETEAAKKSIVDAFLAVVVNKDDKKAIKPKTVEKSEKKLEAKPEEKHADSATLVKKCQGKNCKEMVYGPRKRVLLVPELCIECLYLMRGDVDIEINNQVTRRIHTRIGSQDDASPALDKKTKNQKPKKRKAQGETEDEPVETVHKRAKKD